MSLFIASTGLVMSPRFLAAHLPVLAAGVFLVVLGKGVLVRSPPFTCIIHNCDLEIQTLDLDTKSVVHRRGATGTRSCSSKTVSTFCIRNDCGLHAVMSGRRLMCRLAGW